MAAPRGSAAGTIGALGRPALVAALRQGRLNLHLGPFSTSLTSRSPLVADFLADTYRDCPVSTDADALTDYCLTVGPPNLLRRFIRPQVMPDPGFFFPAVPLPARMAPLALEMGMNLSVALQCFRFALFHAGVVAEGDAAIMIAAHSGGGKSTLTAALMENGFRLMSDEFAILGLDSPVLHAYPRPVSLKKASVEVVRALAGPGEISAALEGTPKGTMAYRRARASDIEAANRPATAKLLVFPTFAAGAPPEIKPVERGDAVMRLIAGSPNYQICGEKAFCALAAMAEGLTAYEIRFGSTEDSVRLVRELWVEAKS